jgi:hypothetical protein
VDISGAKGMLLTLSPGDGDRSGSHPAAQPTYTLLWERDGLLHELETDGLSRDALLETARSVR